MRNSCDGLVTTAQLVGEAEPTGRRTGSQAGLPCGSGRAQFSQQAPAGLRSALDRQGRSSLARTHAYRQHGHRQALPVQPTLDLVRGFVVQDPLQPSHMLAPVVPSRLARIEAIIKPFKLDDLKDRVFEAGVRGMTIS